MTHPGRYFALLLLGFFSLTPSLARAEEDHFAKPPPPSEGSLGNGGQAGRCNPVPVCRTCSDPCCRLCLPERTMNQDQAFQFCSKRGGQPANTRSLRDFSEELRGTTWTRHSDIVTTGLFGQREEEVAIAVGTDGSVHTHKPGCRHYVACEFTTF